MRILVFFFYLGMKYKVRNESYSVLLFKYKE